MCVVDNEDAYLADYSWHYCPTALTFAISWPGWLSTKECLERFNTIKGHVPDIIMQRQKGQRILFVDGNPLNCRRNNLILEDK